jgi:hypothetical protein
MTEMTEMTEMTTHEKLKQGIGIVQNYWSPDLIFESDSEGTRILGVEKLVDEDDDRILNDLGWEYDSGDEKWFHPEGDKRINFLNV